MVNNSSRYSQHGLHVLPSFAQAQELVIFCCSPHPSMCPSMAMLFTTNVCLWCSDLGTLAGAPAVVGNGTRYSPQGLHVLPSFARAQELVTSAGQRILLQPTPFNAPIHDFVDYSADVGQNGTVETTRSSIAQSLKDMAGKLKGTTASQYAPKYGPVTRGDLLLVLPSQLDRCVSQADIVHHRYVLVALAGPASWKSSLV